MNQFRIIELPAGQNKPQNEKQRKRKVKNIDAIKYFTEQQIRLLRETVRKQAELDYAKGKLTGIREWMVIDLLTSTGVRVSESANVRCGDLKIGYTECEIFIRNGKGSKSRHVQIPTPLKQHLKLFLKWKIKRCESIEYDEHLFIGQRGPWTSQAVQQIVKKYLKALGLYERGKAVHALRHSYGVMLYRKGRDIRAIQQQLGHSSIQTSQIYTHSTKEDIQKQLYRFWG
jgi:site-specific recombinase XerD